MCKWGTYKEVILCEPRPVSGRKTISVDACIADLVQAINNAGIKTMTCCCGHGKGDGEVILHDGRRIIIRRWLSEDFEKDLTT